MISDVFWQYKGICEFMAEYPATYAMDIKRRELHGKLLSSVKGVKRKENLTFILHNLPKGFDWETVLAYIDDIEGFKKDLKKYYQ